MLHVLIFYDLFFREREREKKNNKGLTIPKLVDKLLPKLMSIQLESLAMQAVSSVFFLNNLTVALLPNI